MATALRQKSLILPREHGAWGLLLVPLATGASVGLLQGGNGGTLAPLIVAALALFWLRTPIESWMGTALVRARAPGEIRLVRYAAVLLAVVATAALLWLFWGWRNRILLWIGAVAGLAFVRQATVRRFAGHLARTAAQMIGAAGLTATAPAAYCAVTEKGGAHAGFLWNANLLFAINQIHFVRLRIHAARAKNRSEKLAAGRGFLGTQLVLVVLLIAACGLHVFPWYGRRRVPAGFVAGFRLVYSRTANIGDSYPRQERINVRVPLRRASRFRDGTPMNRGFAQINLLVRPSPPIIPA